VTRGDGSSCVIRYTSTHQSRQVSPRAGCVAWTDAPVCMCVRGVWGRGECGIVSESRYTYEHQSRRVSPMAGCCAWTDAPVCMCERGVWGRGGCRCYCAIRYTKTRQSRREDANLPPRVASAPFFLQLHQAAASHCCACPCFPSKVLIRCAICLTTSFVRPGFEFKAVVRIVKGSCNAAHTRVHGR
jgi:hypothetical protein